MLASSRLGEHLAGAFGTDAEYEKSYMPWDELMGQVVERYPELYGPQELVLDSEWGGDVS